MSKHDIFKVESNEQQVLHVFHVIYNLLYDKKFLSPNLIFSVCNLKTQICSGVTGESACIWPATREDFGDGGDNACSGVETWCLCSDYVVGILFRDFQARGDALACRWLGSGSIAALVQCGVSFSQSGMGTLMVSSGLAFIYGEIKDNFEAVLFQRRFKAGCGLSLALHLSFWFHLLITSFAATSLLESSPCALCVRSTLDTSGLFAGGVSLVFSYHPSVGEGSIDSSLIVCGLAVSPIWCTVASLCSVGKWFQALCGVVCNSALVASAKFMRRLQAWWSSLESSYSGNDTKSLSIQYNEENLTF
ncbi:hypothetical protein YC2023_017738 [Brassica napus]